MGACVNGAKTACGGGGAVTNMGSGFYAAPHIFVYPRQDSCGVGNIEVHEPRMV